MTTDYAHAIDDSSWDHPRGTPIDYAAVAADGVTAVFVKLTEGGTHDGVPNYVNPYAGEDVTGFRSHGVKVHPYHFVRPATFSAEDEATVFAAAVAMIGGADELWADVEDGLEQLGAEALSQWLVDFAVVLAGKGVGSLTGWYVDEQYRTALEGVAAHAPDGTSTTFPYDRELWLASPGADPGNPPEGVAVLQYGQATVPGIADPSVDLDAVYTVAAPPGPGDPGTPEPAPPPPAVDCLDLITLGTYGVGHAGAPVKRIQGLLNAAGHLLALDGMFGPLTDAAVRTYQSAHQLATDGIVGPLTWRALIQG